LNNILVGTIFSGRERSLDRMPNTLVIVESPAKAKTINKFLGRGYIVKASMGHVRDLPRRTLGVDEKDFTPTYTILPEKRKTIAELKKAAKHADAIYLAPDPDREGEAICWHLKELLAKETEASFHRVMLHEITRKAVLEAIQNPVEINKNKVDAQQARRILDRLMGYKLSPLLWDKVRRGLSAGRVQSVALRIICEREREIKKFAPREYWSLRVNLEADSPPPFTAKLAMKDGSKKEVESRDEMTAVLADLGWEVSEEQVIDNGKGTAISLTVAPAIPDPKPFIVSGVKAREKKKSPAPPFTTSKLQQDAARQLGFPVAKTMRLAQRLYEGKEIGADGTIGLITYMRTDSTRVSEEALQAVRAFIASDYGDRALPDKPRRFRASKRAQEAHEAIRPTSLDYKPAAIKQYLGRDEFRLYSLIWNRFVASQMENALFDTTSIDIEAGPYIFRASGSVLKYAGWLSVYSEARGSNSSRKDSDNGEDDGEDRRLPALVVGQPLDLRTLLPRQHFTQPPPRYSEASLVKELEENGIGRPSTYASILSTITDRDYVEKEGRRFQPTELGLLVNDLMVASFGDIVNTGYTAKMEEELDLIEVGKLNWNQALSDFNEKFEKDLERARSEMRDVKREAIPTDQVCDKCGKPMVLKWGRFGKFLACSGYPDCKNTREVNASAVVDDGSVSALAGNTSKLNAEPNPIETKADPCEKCGKPMVLRRGRYGQFLACSGYPDCKNTRKVTVDKEGKAEARKDVLLDDKCPRCGARLAIKHGRFGEFTACSSYPTCRYVRMKEIGVDCPECGKGSIVERRSKRGKQFYGCDRYPDCEFVLWKRPVAKQCPDCGRPYLVERITRKHGRVLTCDAENCEYSESTG